MILSRGRRYIFIHIPKTGGTAMALALESRAMKDDIMLGDTPKAKRRRGKVDTSAALGRLWKHSRLADVAGLATIDEMRQFFVFTLVRNPWDRAVSYYHWLQLQRFDHPAVALARTLSFADFIRHPQTRAAFRAGPASSYVCGPGGEDLCNLFIRLESHESDAEPLWRHLGFRLSLDRVNVSPRSDDFRRYYSDSDAELIAQDCAEDIKKFRYIF
ncbi:Type II secretory pathway, pullulanase PulA [Pseudooceanicola sp. 216_PA32_1]|uniref:Type II secretory pathway, pullulanase PulA n=1 Tax=Pseudooceanicola pacificus TaxID=2676438 RepID=A0A844W1N3_9RHOB|nr:sulfotransferase family 2 domain-containing protein [Pseudooceanicola pacificus]MWB77657.1 Type II secretory pathway, pullulanase PulA [Pseudooceanicola pacificus]